LRARAVVPLFTQKERDVETELDYFEARYYSSKQERFISAAEFTGGPDELYTFADEASNNPTFYADLANPQSLNKYQYAYSNPLRYLDPDGHDPQNPCGWKTHTDQKIVQSVTSALDWVADKTGITTAAKWIRRGVRAVAKYALDHGGKSAAQQDMDDLSGRAAKSQNQAQSEG